MASLLPTWPNRSSKPSVEDAHQIDAEDPLPLAERDLPARGAHAELSCDACVIAKNVDVPERGKDRLREPLDLFGASDIGPHGERSVAAGGEERRSTASAASGLGEESGAAAQADPGAQGTVGHLARLDGQ